MAEGAVLVTGGAGFVGGHLARALLERGRRVVIYDIAQAIPTFVTERGQVEHLRYDVTDPIQMVDALVNHGVTDVIHTASLLAEPESLQRPRQFLRVNAESVWQLCDIARRMKHLRRVVSVSTRSVYGSYAPEEGPVREDFAPRPVAFYGASKAAADVVLQVYREQMSLDVVAARITGVFGPFQNYPHPLSQMIDAAVAGEVYAVDSGGDYLYEFTYVKDVVRGLLFLLDAERLSHAIYNVASGIQYRLSEIGDVVRRVVPGANVRIGTGIPRGQALRAALSCERMEQDTGFRCVWPLDEAVAEHVRWKQDGSYGASAERWR